MSIFLEINRNEEENKYENSLVAETLLISCAWDVQRNDNMTILWSIRA